MYCFVSENWIEGKTPGFKKNAVGSENQILLGPCFPDWSFCLIESELLIDWKINIGQWFFFSPKYTYIFYWSIVALQRFRCTARWFSYTHTQILLLKLFSVIGYYLGFPGGSDGKESACNVGDLGSIPGLGRSPGGGHGNPLQYSCLENPVGQRSQVGYSLWGYKKLDTTEQISTHSTNILFIYMYTKVFYYA